MDSTNTKRLHAIAIDVALIAASIAIALLCAEGLLRLTRFAKLLPYEGIPVNYYVADAQAGYNLSKNFGTSTHRFKDASNPIWSNSLGCFDTEYEGNKPYLLLMGDSFAWGFSPFEDKWGVRLQEMLGIRVLTCGVPGYGSHQEFVKTKQLLTQLPAPSSIVVSYFSNDPSDDAAFPNSLVFEGRLIKNLSGDPTLSYEELQERLPQFAMWAQEYCMWNMPAHPALQRTKCFLRNHSVLYILAQSGVKSLVPKSFLQRIGIVNQEPASTEPKAEDYSDHFATLSAFSDLARSEGAQLLFVFIPSKEDTESSGETTTYTLQKDYMKRHGIKYVDFTPEFRTVAHATSAPLYWKEDLHFTPTGNHLLGLLVARELAKNTPSQRKAIESALMTEFGL